MNRSHINRFRSCVQWCCFMAAALVTIFSVSSCKDDEEGMGTPEITGVRVCDPTKADSLFTKASTGQMIAVIGRNLADVHKVYINDQEVSFNPTLNTDHSIIVTIPSEEKGFKLTAFDSTLKDEIRIVTSHGTAVYAFKITAPSPSITALQGSYPREAGNVLKVFGLNLVDIEKVFFTNLTAEQLDTTVWETVGGTIVEAAKVETVVKDHALNSRTQTYETTSQLGVTIPQLPYDKGALVVQTAAGTTYIDFSVLPGRPVILDISSEMPVVGEKVVLTGREFIQVESITFGDVTLGASDLTVSENGDSITFIMPKVPSEGTDGQLTVTTPGGVGSTLFWNYNFILTTFDGDATDNGWDPKAPLEKANGDDPPYTGCDLFAHFYIEGEGQQWWGTMIYFRKDWNGNKFPLPSYDLIPADTPTDKLYLAMEVFNNYSSYNNGKFTGYLRYFLQEDSEDPVPEFDDSGTANPADKVNQYDNFKWVDYNAATFENYAPVLGDINGETPQDRWYRHVVPLTAFAKYRGKTYKDVYEKGINQFRIQSINQGPVRGDIDFCIDNVRIFYKK